MESGPDLDGIWTGSVMWWLRKILEVVLQRAGGEGWGMESVRDLFLWGLRKVLEAVLQEVGGVAQCVGGCVGGEQWGRRGEGGKDSGRNAKGLLFGWCGSLGAHGEAPP